MAHQWRGVIEEYRDRLPVSAKTPVVSLREGGTPLVHAIPIKRDALLNANKVERFSEKDYRNVERMQKKLQAHESYYRDYLVEKK